MTAKMHRVHLPKVGEGVIYIPSGMPFEADDVPKYPAGAYVRLGNKEFIYAIAGGDLVPDVGAMNSYKQKVVRAHCALDSVTGEIVAKGAMVVGVTLDEGLSLSEGVAEDELKGGQFIAFPGDNNTFIRGIISNTVVDALDEATALLITLDSPIPVAIPEDRWCEAIRNPYGAVKREQGNYAMVMGMPTVVATIGQGLWLQVSGPSWAAPAAAVGSAVYNQEVVFAYNGSVALRSDNDVPGDALADAQHAGVCIALAVGEQGSMMIMLQIAH